MRPDGPRPSTTGSESGPGTPFPIRLSGPIIKGFGRGSSDLGIPTANIPISGLDVGGHENVESGVYYGFAGLDLDHDGQRIPQNGAGDSSLTESQKGKVYEMVMSIGWNPFYKNSVRSVEVHILHKFPQDFYGAQLNLLILGFIRPEYDYVSKELLIDDINIDIDVTRSNLARKAYQTYRDDEYLLKF